MSEKIGGAKGSRLDEDFVELERVSIGQAITSFMSKIATMARFWHDKPRLE